ncbi:DUF1080 domain-containing protein [candidate division KSB1 bacterium]|nr:DUF1080 domain-containing protein [candidate division KSB1 bacterium]
MKNLIVICLVIFAMVAYAQETPGDGWISLFDGETLNGWKFSEDAGTFSVQDSVIVVHGKRSHLFYVGTGDASWTNFEFKADVMTEPGANSGIYFHTEFQQDGWPARGYEVQVNNSHSDWRRTGSLYSIVDLKESQAKDNEWFTEHIIVSGKRIIVNVNGVQVIDYSEPENVNYDGMPGRKIGSGTFCLQGHDPKSVVYFKNIMVRPLPE